jgi:uncharacterized protein
MLLIVPHLTCNLSCRYCYETAYRKKNKPKMVYDLPKILKRMEELKKEYPEMCLHGGEPLLMGKKDVRKILTKIKKLTGKSSIQTNGTLIDDDYIKIFKDCCTNVGVSYDGPGELSDCRLHNFKNANIDSKIKKMVAAGIPVSLIVVVSKSNAGTEKKLAKLKKFLLEMNKMKINGRINPCGGMRKYELSEKRLQEVYLDLADFCLKNSLRWSPFMDIVNGLQGKPRVCIFSGCDPFCTPSAAEMIEDGSLTNCMRTNKEYILLRYPRRDSIRGEILSEIPQESGGCKGCSYWKACQGGCPTAAIDDDWRNKTYQCSLWKSLFGFFENILRFCNSDLYGTSCSTRSGSKPSRCKTDHADEHGDSPHGDSGHGDSGHGDLGNHEDNNI